MSLKKITSFSFCLIDKIRRIYWQVFKPHTAGVRVILQKNNQVFLVKHSYSKQWYLPGGEVRKNENPQQALKREILEELGIKLSGNLQLWGKYLNLKEGKIDQVTVFLLQNPHLYKNSLLSKHPEIAQARFFPISRLPLETSPGTRRRIKELKSRKMEKISLRKW